MADTVMVGRTSRAGFYLPRLALLLALLSLALMVLAPLGWRLGLWHFRFSFSYLLRPGALIGMGLPLSQRLGCCRILGGDSIGNRQDRIKRHRVRFSAFVRRAGRIQRAPPCAGRFGRQFG